MRLKPAPRIMLGLAVVGILGYGVNYYIDSRPQPAIATVPEPRVELTQADVLPLASQSDAAAASAAAAVQAATIAAQRAEETTRQAPRTQSDAALDALLKGGSK